MNKNKTLQVVVIGVLAVIVIAFGVYAIFQKTTKKEDVTIDKEKHTVVVHPSGLIYASVPQAGSKISGTVTVLGMAKGSWFFEGSFPVYIVDENGKKIGEGIAQAQGAWMTESYVPYQATVEIKDGPQTVGGAIVLSRDNPSGETESFLTIPVVYK